MKFCIRPINLFLLVTANLSCTFAFQVTHGSSRASPTVIGNSLRNKVNPTEKVPLYHNHGAIDGMRMRYSQLALYQDFNNEDFSSNAEDHDSFFFSESDRARIQKQYDRKETLPILIIGTAILPNQTLEITSSDPKLNSLIDYVLHSSTTDEIGIIGLNPHDQSPLNIGVTAQILSHNVRTSNEGMHTSCGLQITGQRRFEIEEEPHLHSSGSFYMAHVEIVEDREEIMTSEQHSEAEKLSKKLPSLVQTWKSLVYSQSTTMKQQVKDIMNAIGPMPGSELGNDHIGERALWVGSLVNPHPLPDNMKLCSEIRPALLSCKNNYQRIHLAVLSLQSSIDYLTDRKRIV